MKIVKLIIILFTIMNPCIIKSNDIDYIGFTTFENNVQGDKDVDALELKENILINIELRRLSEDLK